MVMEQRVQPQVCFKSKCSLCIGRCTGSDVVKLCPEGQRTPAAELDGGRESPWAQANQLALDVGEGTGACR